MPLRPIRRAVRRRQGPTGVDARRSPGGSSFQYYRRVGLPPPHRQPRLPAIQAAAHPARVNYLYFVALGDRRHQFSQSLTDHNDAVARYRSQAPLTPRIAPGSVRALSVTVSCYKRRIMAPGDESSTLGILPAAAGVSAPAAAASLPSPLSIPARGCAPMLRSIFGSRFRARAPPRDERLFWRPITTTTSTESCWASRCPAISFLSCRASSTRARCIAVSPEVGLHPVNLERPTRRHQACPPALEQGGVVGSSPKGRSAARGGWYRAAGSRHDRLRRGARRAGGDQRHLRGAAGRRFYIPRSAPLAVRFGQPLHFHQTRRAA